MSCPPSTKHRRFLRNVHPFNDSNKIKIEKNDSYASINRQDILAGAVLIDEKYEAMVEVLPVDSLDEVLQHALVGAEEKVTLVERLANVIDTISSGVDTQPSA